MSLLPSETDQADVAQYFDIRLHAKVVNDALIEKTAELLDQLIEPDSKRPRLAVDRISYLGSGPTNRVHRIALSWLEKARERNNRPLLQQPLETSDATHLSVHIPDTTTLNPTLEAPPHSAVSENSVSSNATICGDGKPGTNTLMMEMGSATAQESSRHQGPTHVESTANPSAALAKSLTSNKDLADDKEKSSFNSRDTSRISFQNDSTQKKRPEKDTLAEKKRFRKVGTIFRFFRDKILGSRSQTA
ncbi:hypothetical protein FKW77_003117 [Venturia effusa]|uniref:Uncharacterized protein n=1 Tax=Venturia effusa TaxID=50376 RepID=A0A517LQ15_9PEZI|nr:hypothetical protein FKW77_003117 [Venturia effusa]